MRSLLKSAAQFLLGCFINEFSEFFMYSRYVVYQIRDCRYLLPVYGLFFYSVSVFQRVVFLILESSL